MGGHSAELDLPTHYIMRFHFHFIGIKNVHAYPKQLCFSAEEHEGNPIKGADRCQPHRPVSPVREVLVTTITTVALQKKEKKKKKDVRFAKFHRVNTPTTADFKLSS